MEISRAVRVDRKPVTGTDRLMATGAGKERRHIWSGGGSGDKGENRAYRARWLRMEAAKACKPAVKIGDAATRSEN